MKKLRFLIVLLFVFMFVLFFKPVTKTIMKAIYPLRYENYIVKYSNEYNLDKYLVMAIIKAESNFIYDAHSGYAKGLMQITPNTFEWIANKLSLDYGTTDILNPETNIKMGCYYMRYLLDYFNQNEKLSICAYNAGMGNVNKWLKNPDYSKSGTTLDFIPFEETNKYYNKIKNSIDIYKKLY